MSKVSKKRYDYCMDNGRSIEDLFIESVKVKNPNIRRATKEEDMYKHIDVWVSGLGVDVKGHRHNDCIWLELTNVHGHKGWLRGQATLIAFHFEDKNVFRVFFREDLLRFVMENVTEKTKTKKDFLKIYTREKWGKKDEVVKVKLSHIKHLKHRVLKCIK